MILTKLVYSIIIGENDIVFKKNIDYSKNGLKILCFNDLENYKGGDARIEKREKSWTDSEDAHRHIGHNASVRCKFDLMWVNLSA